MQTAELNVCCFASVDSSSATRRLYRALHGQVRAVKVTLWAAA